MEKSVYNYNYYYHHHTITLLFQVAILHTPDDVTIILILANTAHEK